MKALLSSTDAVVYVDDVLIKGRNEWEHNINLRGVMSVLAKAGMHVNATKVQCAQKSVRLLGYDISKGNFSLDTYVQEQRRKLRTISSITEIKKKLGVFNVCRGLCPDLAIWVQPLQYLLKRKHLTKEIVVIELTKQIWEKVVRQRTNLCLMGEPAEFQLMMDYSSRGSGYAWFAESYEESKLIIINSRGNVAGAVNSYLGELQAICSALNESRNLVQGRRLILWIDSESAFKRIRNCDGDPKCLYDVRVARVLLLLGANFTC